MISEELKRKLYEAYRLDWMISHGHTLPELMRELDGCTDDETGSSIQDTFSEWESDFGFRQELWACYDEFCNNELYETGYMKSLIMRMPDHDVMTDAYNAFLREAS